MRASSFWLLFLLTGCAATTTGIAPVFDMSSPPDEGFGSTAHVTIARNPNAPLLQALKGRIEARLQAKGYRLVSTPKEAYLAVDILLRSFVSTVSESSETKFVKNDVEEKYSMNVEPGQSVNTLSLAAMQNAYGEVPKPLAAVQFNFLDSAEKKILLEGNELPVFARFLDFIPTPGNEELNPKRPPGCILGFGMVSYAMENNEIYVEHVQSGTPAAKAGLQAGDKILGIDSMSAENISATEWKHIVSSRQEVPFKAKRGDAEIRGKIQSTVYCLER